MKRMTVCLAAALFVTFPAKGASIALTLTLPDPGAWQHVSYSCDEQEERLAVDYLNAAPNFLALVPVDGKSLVFANVISGSGARYASGRYEWWTKGPEARLTDLTAGTDDPPLLTCLEATETP
jgi:membrane-bound inhibitor of C-type lysozyme